MRSADLTPQASPAIPNRTRDAAHSTSLSMQYAFQETPVWGFLTVVRTGWKA